MLLDQVGPKRSRGQVHVSAERVVGEADRDPEPAAHGLHSAQVAGLGRCGVGAHAVEERDGYVGGAPDDVEGLGDLALRRHSGADEQGDPCPCRGAKKRKVREFEARDL